MFSVIIYFLIYLNVTDRLLLNLQVIISSLQSFQQVHPDVLAVPGPIVSRNLGRPLFGLYIPHFPHPLDPADFPLDPAYTGGTDHKSAKKDFPDLPIAALASSRRARSIDVV